jgi:hypothetical protein
MPVGGKRARDRLPGCCVLGEHTVLSTEGDYHRRTNQIIPIATNRRTPARNDGYGFRASPRQDGWSQWHASAVTFFESWQIWLQYFCLSGAIQLQAGCAHFFVPAIPVLLIFRNLATFRKEQGSPDLADVEGRETVFPESRHFSRESRLRIISPIVRLRLRAGRAMTVRATRSICISSYTR